jgi:hypothetical protein
MQMTLIGFVQILIGSYLLLARRVEAMMAFTMACTLMGGAASLSISALGNASVGPGQLALAFFILRILLHRDADTLLVPAIRQNASMLVFALYGAVAATILPRIFRNTLNVVPMKPVGLRSLYDTAPLEPTSQNVTTAVYMIGTALCALTIFIAVRQPRGATRFVKTAVVITWVHAVLGILSAIGNGTWIQGVLMFFRNGNYAQVEQMAGGLVRINGIMPEASAFAGYGMFWCILMTELWLRNIMPRRTGPAAMILALVLVASTSSTAYVGLGFYLLVIASRMLLFPSPTNARKLVSLFVVLMTLIVVGCLMVLLNQQLATNLYTLFEHLTVDKMNGSSGKQRSFWAYQGFDAFMHSYGLGIGPGSFRSSSLITAIVGSVGVVGSAAFVLYCLAVLKPLRASTFLAARDPIDATGVSAAWAAILALVPLAVTNPSSDPTLAFGLFAGAALGLRSIRSERKPPQALHTRPTAPQFPEPARGHPSLQ